MYERNKLWLSLVGLLSLGLALAGCADAATPEDDGGGDAAEFAGTITLGSAVSDTGRLLTRRPGHPPGVQPLARLGE